MPKITVDLSEEAIRELVENLRMRGKCGPKPTWYHAGWVGKHPELYEFKGIFHENNWSEVNPYIVLDSISERSATERSDTKDTICEICNEPFAKGDAVFTYKDVPDFPPCHVKCVESYNRGKSNKFPNPICGSTSQAQTRNSEVEQDSCICEHNDVCHVCRKKRQSKWNDICGLCGQINYAWEKRREEFPHHHIHCIEDRDAKIAKRVKDKETLKSLQRVGVPIPEEYILDDSSPAFKNPSEQKESKYPICPWCKKKVKTKGFDLSNTTYQGDTAWHKDCFFEFRHHR